MSTLIPKFSLKDGGTAPLGAVNRPINQKLSDSVSVKDFGAVGDGITNDTAAIQAAIDFCSNTGTRTIYIPGGNYLISSTITLPSGVALLGEGYQAAFVDGSGGYPSRFTKASSMTTTGLLLTGRNLVQNLAVLNSGGTGYGVWVGGNGCAATNLTSNGHTIGIRVGADAGAFLNCNTWALTNICASYNTSHGIYISDNYAGSVNANAGSLINGDIRSNGGTGLLVGNCFRNTFINVLTEVNTGYGIHLNSSSQQHTVIGGDTDEGNTAGNFLIEGEYHNMVGVGGSSFVDNSNGTQYLGYAGTKFIFTEIGGYARISGASSSAVELLRLRNAAAEGTGYGDKITFEVPHNAAPFYRVGGDIRCVNSAVTDTDAFLFFVNTEASGLENFLQLDGRFGYGVFPGSTDNVLNLGMAFARWATVFAGTPAINTSDEREKQQIKDLSDAEKQVAIAIKGLIKSFKFNDAVAKKGDKARIHFGVIAQQVAEAFKTVGLNPDDYAMFCYDKWDSEKDADGNETLAAGDCYGIRYEELLAFVISAL
jgi:hypothetical protein